MTLLDNSPYIKESKLVHSIPKDLPLQKSGFVDWETYFGNSNPVELEIGTGRTHYLFERADRNPDHNMVGIEWKLRWVAQANRKIAREGIKNVYAIHANAWVMTAKMFAPQSLENVSIQFPDPWWKKRHQKRRVINDEFTDILVDRLKPNGTFFIQSDVKTLLEGYMEILEKHSNLENLAGVGLLYPENPMNAQSHREKKVLEGGLPVYRAFFKKIK